MHKLLTREVRKYIYGVAIAFIPLAVFLGWVDIEASALILPLLMAILNLSPEEVSPDEGSDEDDPEADTVFVDPPEDNLGKHGIPEGAVIPKED